MCTRHVEIWICMQAQTSAPPPPLAHTLTRICSRTWVLITVATVMPVDRGVCGANGPQTGARVNSGQIGFPIKQHYHAHREVIERVERSFACTPPYRIDPRHFRWCHCLLTWACACAERRKLNWAAINQSGERKSPARHPTQARNRSSVIRLRMTPIAKSINRNVFPSPARCPKRAPRNVFDYDTHVSHTRSASNQSEMCATPEHRLMGERAQSKRRSEHVPPHVLSI